jgi:predicted nuclease of predicted toxin-antitoxin system
MKLLLDENLSPKMAVALVSEVKSVGIQNAPIGYVRNKSDITVVSAGVKQILGLS